MKPIPYCPNQKCQNHSSVKPDDNTWWIKRGFDFTKKDKKLQRYQCKKCGKTFTM